MKVLRKTMVFAVSTAFFVFLVPMRAVQNVCRKVFLKQNAESSFNIITEIYAAVLASVEDGVKRLLPEAEDIKEEVKTLTEEQKKRIGDAAKVKFNPEFDNEFHVYIGTKAGAVNGYAILNTVKGKWGPIEYMLGLSPEGKIRDAMVLSYKERRGRPVAKRRFLDQFIGKTVNDKIKLKKDIRGVSGATISSKGMTNGIRKLVYVFNELYRAQSAK